MKTFLLFSIIAQTFLSTGYTKTVWDKEADQLIKSSLNAADYTNKHLTYSYPYHQKKEEKYELRIISNPLRLFFEYKEFKANYRYVIALSEDMPHELHNHLKELTADKKKEIAWRSGPFTVDGRLYSSVEFFGLVQPILPVDIFKQALLDCLTSKTFVNTTIDYKGSRVRIIWNPEGKHLWAEGLEAPVEWPLHISIEEGQPPSDFYRYLEQLIKEAQGEDYSAIIDLETKTLPEVLRSLRPVDSFEKEFLNCFTLKTFVNTAIEHTGYQTRIRIIWNPEGKYLWAEGLEDPIEWRLHISIEEGRPPKEFFNYLEQLLNTALGINHPSAIYVGHVDREFPLSIYSSIRPIIYSGSIANSAVDTHIQEVFQSKELMNEVFHYSIDNKWYAVRIIHNPDNSPLEVKIVDDFTIEDHHFSITWNYKYAILINKEAPQELVDHLSHLVNISWIDWLLNFQVANGTKAIFHRRQGSDFSILWFKLMNKANISIK